MAKKKKKQKTSRQFKKIVLLIDAENETAFQHVEQIVEAFDAYDKHIAKYAYGDWSNPCLSPWKDAARRYNINTISQPNLVPGKSLADMRLIIDAMDFMYKKNYGTYVIVSSDSDFTPLCQKLRSAGKTVIVIGSHPNVSTAFINACDYYLDMANGYCIGIKPPKKPLKNLVKKIQESTCPTQSPANPSTSTQQPLPLADSIAEPTSTPDPLSKKPIDPKLRTQMWENVKKAYKKIPKTFNSGFVPISVLGDQLQALHAPTTYKKLGFGHLKAYLQSEPEYYEIKNDGKRDTVKLK